MWRWLDIRGRGSVDEFWLVFFLYLLVTTYAFLGLSSPDVQGPWRTGLIAVLWLAVLVLWISAIRRFHDLGDGGLNSLFLMPFPLLWAVVPTMLHAQLGFDSFIELPFLVQLAAILAALPGVIGLFMLKDDGESGRNRFGPDPGLARRARRPHDAPPTPSPAAGRLSWLNPAGRAPRSELVAVAAPWLLSTVILLMSLRASPMAVALGIGASAVAVVLTPWLAIAAVRRVHDFGLGAGMALLAALGPAAFLLSFGLGLWHPLWALSASPTLYIALGMLIVPGQAAANRYGENPRPPRPATRRRAAAVTSEDAVRIRRRMMRNARQALTTVPAEGPAASWFGGAPELPLDLPWPKHEDQPLCFVAQLDLAEVRAAGGPDWLPADGALSFFLALDEAPYGERTDAATTWRVIHHPAGQTLSARDVPSSVTAVWRERRIGFRAVKSIPSLDWLGVDVTEIDVEDAELDTLADLPLADRGDGPHHVVGGYPNELQNAQLNLVCAWAALGLDPHEDHPPELAARALRDAKSWRQLLQVDYDEDLGMRWPGGGRFYFFVREKDALKGDFSRTCLLSQIG